MSGQLTQFGANRAVQAGVGTAVSAAAGCYLALTTGVAANPDTATLATWAALEIGTAGYARQAVTWTPVSGDPSSVGNWTELTFGPFSADPPEVTHAFICDVTSGSTGNVMAYWELTTARDVGIGAKLRVNLGDLTMTVD
jgi:hypothetical protein